MRNKIIGGIIGGCLLIAATVPPTPKVDVNNLSFEQAVSFCADAYSDFKKTKKNDYLQHGLSLLPAGSAKAVNVVCASYAVGFEAGQESMVRRT